VITHCAGWTKTERRKNNNLISQGQSCKSSGQQVSQEKTLLPRAQPILLEKFWFEEQNKREGLASVDEAACQSFIPLEALCYCVCHSSNAFLLCNGIVNNLVQKQSCKGI